MAIQVQIRRGTTSENNAFTGAQGEVTVNTINNSLRIHDGETVGGHIVLSESQITNCITEIPQDIKLELNNGTLTLKAGSKVYVPNGSGVFNEVVITNNITPQPFSVDDDVYAVYAKTSQQLFVKKLSGFVSGDTTPQAINDGIWYNTTAHRIEWYNDSTWSGDGGRSFPIAIITVSGGAISSIDQIFNGFGYIGSTVFALPGVKGLIPNGRNTDGTLKNTTFTVSNVLTETDTTAGNDDIYVVINSSGLYRKTKTIYTYNKEENLNIYNGANDNATPICWHSRTSGVISNFTPKTAFHAVDYSDAVRTSSDQTIDGTKTFTTPIVVKRTSGQRLIICKDANNVDIGTLEAVDNSNDNYTELFAFDENGSNSAQIGIHYNNGSPYGFAPTPASVYDNSTKIATTAHIVAILDKIYPIGALYIGTQTTCPMAALIPNSTWTLVATDQALWGGDGTNANTTIAAGLPNITGVIQISSSRQGADGCCTSTQVGGSQGWDGWGSYNAVDFSIDASRSSSIYRNDVTTVQPPAYVVNVWRRVS